jgi:hypothetical protein
MLLISESGGAALTSFAEKMVNSSEDPWTSMKTPELEFRTVPVKPSSVARLKTKGRNPTPCTMPFTTMRCRAIISF